MTTLRTWRKWLSLGVLGASLAAVTSLAQAVVVTEGGKITVESGGDPFASETIPITFTTPGLRGPPTQRTDAQTDEDGNLLIIFRAGGTGKQEEKDGKKVIVLPLNTTISFDDPDGGTTRGAVTDGIPGVPTRIKPAALPSPAQIVQDPRRWTVSVGFLTGEFDVPEVGGSAGTSTGQGEFVFGKSPDEVDLDGGSASRWFPAGNCSV